MTILGSETPRIFTPPVTDLSPEHSDGYKVIEFAEEILGITLLPWQKWLLIHALERRDDGLYRFRTVVLLVARQNGKTLIMMILALWHIYVNGSRTVIATAQDLTNAEKAWGEAVEMAEGTPELADEIANVNKQRGAKQLLLNSGEQYRVAAASRRGARGFTGDMVLLDELREHQSWDAWGAATKTTLARPHAQVWAFSNAGDAVSLVLRHLRALAHQSLGWPDGDGDAIVLSGMDDLSDEDLEDGDSLGFFEWSAPPTAARKDREAWAQANPSMGYTITERAIASALRTDPPSVFLPEVMCRWLSTAAGGPFPEGKWETTAVSEGAFADSSPRVICVDVSWNRSKAYIARAGFMDDHVPLIDIAAARSGTDWVLDWLITNRERYKGVVIQSNGAPVTSLLVDIENAKDENGYAIELPVIAWAGADLGSAFGLMYDRLESSDDDQKVRHLPHPGMDMGAATAVPKVLPQGAIVLDRAKSPVDAAPLTAAIGALWGLHQVEEAPERSYYADNDVMTL